jgi:hypothetical protein
VLATLVAAAALEISSWLSPVRIFAMGTGLQPKDTEFIVGPCSGTPDENGMIRHRTGLQSTHWDERGHLNIRYAIETNCVAPFNYGGYRMQGDTLTLEYSVFWKPFKTPDGKYVVMKTACTCGYELKYRISGLAKKRYSIDIIEVEKR